MSETNLSAFLETNLTIDGNDTERHWVKVDIRADIYPILMPVVLSLCLVSLWVSSFVVFSAPFVKRPMSPTIRLSLSLSAANAAVSALIFIGTLIHSYLPMVYTIHVSSCLSLAVEALRMGVILVQVYHLLAVALIHYLGTLKPLQYAAMLTPQCLKMIVIGLWTIPVTGIFIGFSSVSGQGFQSEGCKNNHFRMHGIYFRYVWSLIYFGPTLALILVYLHIFIILNRRAKCLIDSEHRRNLTRNMKTVKTTAMIVLTFLVGWSPAVLTFLLICDDCYFQIRDLKTSIAVFSTTYILIILKVFVDTFIYSLRLPEIRESLRHLCRFVGHCCFLCSDPVISSGQRLHHASTGTSRTKSSYLNSIHSLSFGSQREKSLKQSLCSSMNKSLQHPMEMKPFFDRRSSRPVDLHDKQESRE